MKGQGLTRPRRVVAIDQMRMIDRNCEIPHEGPFCDLMWSDPEDIETWAISPRGAGWLFGSRVTAEFNEVRPATPKKDELLPCHSAARLGGRRLMGTLTSFPSR